MKEENGNYTFIGTPDLKVHSKVVLSEGAFYMAFIFALVVVLTNMMIVFSFIAGEFSIWELIIILLVSIPVGILFYITILGLVLALLLLSNLWMNEEKWDKDAVYKVIIEKECIRIVEDSYLIKKEDRIQLSSLERITKDVVPFFDEQGIKLPIFNRPFLQIVPEPRIHRSLLYCSLKRNPPLDHLIRIDMKETIYIKDRNPAYDYFHKTKEPQFLNAPVDTVIISIRPDEQDKFKNIVQKKIEGLGNKKSPRVLGPPPK